MKRTVVLILTAFLLQDSNPSDLKEHSKIAPAAWGADHVGQPVPEYMTGEECLFCHRNDIGAKWNSNRHNSTIRELPPESPALAALNRAELKEFAEGGTLLMGSQRRQRFLRRTDEYGKLDLLSLGFDPKAGKLVGKEKPHWDSARFADRCAGCHCTGVDSTAKTFSSPSIDCYACHGEVTLDHAKDTSLVYLSKKRKDEPRVVASICGQCHIRTGTAKSSGLPFPNNFVAGDNLFRDFQVDFSDGALDKLNPGDRHVLENIRDIVLYGKEDLTCISCHSIHEQSSRKHHRLPNSRICLNCHHETGSKKLRTEYEVHSKLCEY